MRGREIRLKPQCLAVGADGFGRLAAPVQGEAEVIPCPGVPGQVLDGRAEAADGVGGPIRLEEFVAVEEGAGARGRATGDAKRGCEEDRCRPMKL